MAKFEVNIKNRTRNYQLPATQALMPLFEAIVNSIHAIEERKKNQEIKGEILIKIERLLTQSNELIGSIESISIIDNGVGFDKDNFKSFLTSDSDYKEKYGGKGVGRFSWLKAFDSVEINSEFYIDNALYKRNFEFSLSKEDINEEYEDCKSVNPLTCVKLKHFKQFYQKNAPKNLESIAIKIIQHCFVYFLSEDCPSIKVEDESGSIDLNAYFSSKIAIRDGKDNFIVDGECFSLQKIKVNGTIIDNHRLYLCGNDRLVETKDLSKLIVNLDKALSDTTHFWFLGIVTSNYLDANVDMNRLSFNIPDTIQETPDDSFAPIVTMSKIIAQAVILIEDYLSDFLKPIAQEKKKRISNYICSQAPQYRHLLKYKPSQLDKIQPGISDEKLDSILYKLDREFDMETKEEGQILVKQLKNDITNTADYKRRFEEHIAKISDENKSILAKYVAHRKAIIDLFEVGMYKQSDDKYVREEFMHNLIYPMRTTSDEIDYEQHNLWLIDERLAYFFFASSDIPFNNDRKEDRPDLMLLDNSIALLESKNDGTAYDNIVLFELKKPMRGDLAINDPIEQITNYMEKIQSNTVNDKNGRPIRTDEHTKFYLYVVCDALEKFKSILKNRYSFKDTIDKLGMFRMNDNQYIEVLTYDKIVNDAKKRNKILFNKLGIL